MQVVVYCIFFTLRLQHKTNLGCWNAIANFSIFLLMESYTFVLNAKLLPESKLRCLLSMQRYPFILSRHNAI